MAFFLQLVVYGLAGGAIIAMGAMAFSLVYSTTGHFHIAQASVTAVGSYAAYSVMNWIPAVWPVAFAVAIVATSLTGVLVHILIYEPLMKHGATTLSIFIGSLGVLTIIDNTLLLAFGAQPLLFDSATLSRKIPLVGSTEMTLNQLLSILLALATWALVSLYLKRSTNGRHILATASNADTARVVGIDVRRVMRMTYIISSAMLAPAAVLVVFASGAEPYGGTLAFLLAAIAALMSGGKLLIALIAGFAFGLLQSLSTLAVSAQWQTTTALFVFLAILLIRPTGITSATRAAGV